MTADPPAEPAPAGATPAGTGHSTAAASAQELGELGGRLLERGDPAAAAEAFANALARLDPDDPVRGQMLAGLGVSFLDQALAAFAEAAESRDARVRAVAAELLARGLALRERDEEAAAAWQRGLADPDPEAAASVRARLRRASGGDGEPGRQFWWDGFVESAVCHGTLGVLANELFGALDHMYALVAVPYAQGARQRELWEALSQAVRVPSAYAWGRELYESFRGRLRDAMGAASDVLPPDWPEAG
jgi:hypothetical protein